MSSLTEIFYCHVVPRRVNVLPINVWNALAVADHVAAYDAAIVRRQPADHHRIGECSRPHVGRLAGRRGF